jgi:hypothetical protein
MDTRFKGEIARLKAIQRALELGFIPATPVVEQARYDLVIDDGTRLHRVQIKYTDTASSNADNAYYVNLRRANNGTKVCRVYTAKEIDAVIVYIAAVDKLCWFGPHVFDGRNSISIRTAPSKNGQVKNCLLVDNYKW